MRHLGGHPDALAQRGVRMNRLADVDCVGAHLDGQRHLTDHVACMDAHHAATEDLAVAVGFGAVTKQKCGDTLIAAVGNGAARGRPRLQTLRTLVALVALDALDRRLGRQCLGLQNDVVERLGIHLLPNLHPIAVRALQLTFYGHPADYRATRQSPT